MVEAAEGLGAPNAVSGTAVEACQAAPAAASAFQVVATDFEGTAAVAVGVATLLTFVGGRRSV